jgi:tRNA (mo5U34)-methyltransferase
LALVGAAVYDLGALPPFLRRQPKLSPSGAASEPDSTSGDLETPLGPPSKAATSSADPLVGEAVPTAEPFFSEDDDGSEAAPDPAAEDASSQTEPASGEAATLPMLSFGPTSAKSDSPFVAGAEPDPSPVSAPTLQRHLLRYTGSLDRAAFDERCATLRWWYHSYYFDNGFEIRGDYDIGADVATYGFPDDMNGMSVLDIGSGAGWFSQYFHQAGARVTSVDARGYTDFDVFGRVEDPSVEDEIQSGSRKPDRYDADGRPVYYSPVGAGYWTMRDILGSDIRFRNASVYKVGPELFPDEKFDLVFMGALLVHLRDPIGALMAARSVCSGQIIASTPVILGEPESEFPPRQALPYTDIDRVSWWLPNEACFRRWFLAAGFRDVDLSRSVTLRMDKEHRDESERVVNGDQTHRVGHAIV